MIQVMAVALGGASGAVFRFFLSTAVYGWLGRGFPYGTLAVNLIGSFIIGLLSELFLQQRIAVSADMRAAVLVGFLGAFTTFSTFSLETVTLLEQGSLLKALGNISISVTGCLVMTMFGLQMGRALFN